MIHNGYIKREIILYLLNRNNTEEIANNFANFAMELAKKSEIKEEKNTLLLGGVLLLFGVGITFYTYNNAQQGGTFVITYGVIIYGAFILINGLLKMLDIKDKAKKWKNTIIKF